MMAAAAAYAVIAVLVIIVSLHFGLIVPVALVLILAVRWAFWPSRHLARNRARHLRLRLHLRLRPGQGHASLLQLWLRWGRLASFRESRRVRPSLPAAHRLAHPQTHSLYLGRAQMRHAARVSVQEHGCIIGPPRSHKSALLSRLIMGAPGSVVSTSSKPDMFALTSGLRALRGPVHVFNPQDIGGVPSTVRWNPIQGCQDPSVAIRRADAFAHAAETHGTEDGSFWATQASDHLRAMFAAGAVAAADMRVVSRWVLGSSAEDAVSILLRSGFPAWAKSLAQLDGPAEKTNATVRMVMRRALAYTGDPSLATATASGPGGFDIDDFLLSAGTLYMIAKGDGTDATLGPLFAALASEIEYRATKLGSQMPGARLDPPLLLALDEVTQICPVPLPSWLADAGGQGVQVWAAFHGVAQLRSRWKAAGAQTVLDTANVKVFMPGLSDTETLEQASKLCGHAAYRERGEERRQRHEVLTADMIRQLPAGFPLVIRGAHSPVVIRVAKGWEHRGYRRAKRQGWATATVQPVLPPLAIAGGGGAPGELAPPPRLHAVDDLPAAAAAVTLPPAAGAGQAGPVAAYPWTAR